MTQKKHVNFLKHFSKPEQNYIVLDLEWNQAMSRNSEIFNRLPIHLGGEIIEIGAVKLRGDYSPGEEFTLDVRPVFFKKMHYKVSKITGIDSKRLSTAPEFPDAMEKFAKWAGKEPVFITWGNDDRNIFEQNVIVHDLDYDWIKDWINLQLIYNVQTGADKNQKSLAEAMEHFSIAQTRTAHDALGDAYNTALVCSKLDMKKGLSEYDQAPSVLASRMPRRIETAAPEGPEPVLHDSCDGFESKAAAFESGEISSFKCPKCGKICSMQKWINQGDGRYMNLYSCPEHGAYLMRIRFKKNENNTMLANRLVYEADEEMTRFYRNKAAQARRRGRGNGRKGARRS